MKSLGLKTFACAVVVASFLVAGCATKEEPTAKKVPAKKVRVHKVHKYSK